MAERGGHREFVDEWLARAQEALPADPVVLLDRGLAILWAEARRTLSDVTLGAIVARVLHTAADTYPFLLGIEPGAAGVDVVSVLRSKAPLDPVAVRAATSVVLTNALTVLGNLTADILTPAIRAGMLRQIPPAETAPERLRSGPPRSSEEGG